MATGATCYTDSDLTQHPFYYLFCVNVCVWAGAHAWRASDNPGDRPLLPRGCRGHSGSLARLRTDLFYLFRDVRRSLKPVFHPALVSEEQDEAGSRQHQQQCEDDPGDQDGLLQPGGG